MSLAAARVYVGTHYPGDVLAGLALGAAVAGGGLAAVPLLRDLVGLIERTPLRPVMRAGPRPVEARTRPSRR